MADGQSTSTLEQKSGVGLASWSHTLLSCKTCWLPKCHAFDIISSMDMTNTEDKIVDAEVVENPLEAEEKKEEMAKLAQEKLEAYAARRRKYWAERERQAKKAVAKRRKADKAARRARRLNRK